MLGPSDPACYIEDCLNFKCVSFQLLFELPFELQMVPKLSDELETVQMKRY